MSTTIISSKNSSNNSSRERNRRSGRGRIIKGSDDRAGGGNVANQKPSSSDIGMDELNSKINKEPQILPKINTPAKQIINVNESNCGDAITEFQSGNEIASEISGYKKDVYRKEETISPPDVKTTHYLLSSRVERPLLDSPGQQMSRRASMELSLMKVSSNRADLVTKSDVLLSSQHFVSNCVIFYYIIR